jgi:hypothetical protein
MSEYTVQTDFDEAPDAHFVVLNKDQHERIVTIRRDGAIEVNPKYTVDEAAKAFWDAVMQTAGTWRRIA